MVSLFRPLELLTARLGVFGTIGAKKNRKTFFLFDLQPYADKLLR